ncbi:hypothetical protein THRCLA_03184 [Thraustotheca clavata]|uniref:RecQ-mediated genome instability protein 1 n=1 Tax=Thraustotheca clavata TaxID=74557 RepID=A0A1W0A2U7_9STRA|nr:hypothetical protein THRCLA_03184 [Thraustotheca clavata]
MEACLQIARVREDWALECESLLMNYMQRKGGRPLTQQEKDEFIVDQFLFADIRLSCDPCLPENVQELDRVKLQGRFYLQIVDIANISANHEQRKEDTSNRMLKLCLTDGSQMVYAIEYSPLRGLSTQTPPGTKILVEQAEVRRGLLLLKAVEVLGPSSNPTLEQTAKLQSEVEEGLKQSSVQLVDLDLSDEERDTDPAIKHLFYSPSTKVTRKSQQEQETKQNGIPKPQAATTKNPTPTQSNATSFKTNLHNPTAAQANNTNYKTPYNPPAAQTRVMSYKTQQNPSQAQPSAVSYKPQQNPPHAQTSSVSYKTPLVTQPKIVTNFPFTYLSLVEAQLTTSSVVCTFRFKAFVKSVAAFAYANGYDLKVYIEDGTRTLLVAVAPQYVEQLMGVSCAVFKNAMEVDIARGAAWVQTMQLRLQALEGLMTIRFQPSVMPQLEICEDFTAITAKALRERLLR